MDFLPSLLYCFFFSFIWPHLRGKKCEPLIIWLLLLLYFNNYAMTQLSLSKAKFIFRKYYTTHPIIKISDLLYPMCHSQDNWRCDEAASRQEVRFLITDFKDSAHLRPFVLRNLRLDLVTDDGWTWTWQRTSEATNIFCLHSKFWQKKINDII